MEPNLKKDKETDGLFDSPRYSLIAGSLPEQLKAVMDLKSLLSQFPAGLEFDRIVHAWPLWNEFVLFRVFIIIQN